ncbi:hypothetical protein SELMODRAFT_271634 [Selaginella moellendorffii]|uniref:DJ-1/PfpI domain-containing protein n=2 Tax=Selaginella moellendorffii TaxID=88036 RepID=D8SJK8_SELML|nr:protein DJ-1 homolog D isoform X1 [Selaginella moellendorffii]EFJ15467.1 hypothetical protein SELMODRAFT_271634 [Selaginella moellendorffii]|eukprot:XP_002983566.1 protein DJ-1 homolog D isoform X1 [Selaginella moellendorffii]
MASSRSVLLICGDFVEDYEVMVPFQALQAYGVKVDAVCPGKKAGESCATAIHDFVGFQTYAELRGHNFSLNKDFHGVKAESYDALVIPGGRAPEYLSLDDEVLEIVKSFHKSRKPIASICHGQLILAAAGILQGKKSTAYPAVKPVIVSAGGVWQEPNPISKCFRDGSLITGAAYPGHPEFIGLLLDSLGATIENGKKKVLMLCGDFMEDYEAMVPCQTLQAVGYTVDSVCPGKKAGETVATAVHDFEGAQTYSEKPGHNFPLTATFDAVKAEGYDALVIPGGRAPEYLSLNDKVLRLVREFDTSSKPIASICHGQQILAAAGVLQGKKCTAYPAVKPQVVLSGAEWIEPDPITMAHTHGKLVTAAAWPAHPEFVAQLLSLLGTTIHFK